MIGKLLNFSTIASSASRLYHWLGTFWTKVMANKSAKAARGIQKGLATNATQIYVDLDSHLLSIDRRNIPVFSRIRWKPLRIDYISRNRAEAAMYEIGDDVEIGDDIEIGGYKDDEYVYYTLDTSSLAKLPDCICGSIYNEDAKILVNGRDFVIRDSSIIFREEDDPFNPDNGFSISVDMVTAREYATLWAYDSEVDTNNIYNHIGYVVGKYYKSSQKAKDVVNAIWDAYSMECNEGVVVSIVGALYGIPVSKGTEVIESIDHSTGKVYTDKNIYDANPDYIDYTITSTLNYGQPIDSRIVVHRYPFAELSGTLSLSLPKYMFDSSIDGGTTLSNAPRYVYEDYIYRFRIFDNEEKDNVFWDKYWEGVDEDVEQSSQYHSLISHVTPISPEIVCNDDTFNSPQPVVGTISPLSWWLLTAGYQTIIVEVKTDNIPNPDILIDIGELLPAGVNAIIIETVDMVDTVNTSGYGSDGVAISDVINVVESRVSIRDDFKIRIR